MAELKLGPGVKAIAFFVIVCSIFSAGFYFGKQSIKKDQALSERDVIAEDSVKGIEITNRTNEAKVKTDEAIKSFEKPIVDDSGYVSNELMQLLRAKVDEARSRGN